MRRFNEFRWAVATTLARWSGNRLYRPIKGLLALSVVVGFTALGYHTGKKTGHEEGVDFVHGMCYNTGGVVIHEDGRAIQCQRLTNVPKKELDKFMNT